MKKLFLVGFLFMAAIAFGEDSSTAVTPGSTEAVVPMQVSDAKVIGGVDLRPSWGPAGDESHTENLFFLGYQFDKKVKVSANLLLDNNLYSPGNKTSDYRFRDKLFWLRTDVSNLYKNGDVSLSYTNRVYLPIQSTRRDAGMITSVRNYFNLSNKVAENLTLTLSEVPIFHIYDVAGTSAGANAWFENRIYASADLVVGPVTVSPILWWAAKRNRNFAAGALNNDGWNHHLEFDLDVIYGINQNLGVGVGYYTDNMLGSTKQGFIDGVGIGNGIENGIVQFVLQATL